MKNLDELTPFLIDTYNVELKFTPEVKQDLKAINKGNRTSTLALKFLGRKGELFEEGGQLGIEKLVIDTLDTSFKHLNNPLKHIHILRRCFFVFQVKFPKGTSFIWNNNYKLKQ